MPLVHPCAEHGCTTLTMGERCLEHEQLAARRRRPHMSKVSRRFRAPFVAVGIAAAAAFAGRAFRSG